MIWVKHLPSSGRLLRTTTSTGNSVYSCTASYGLSLGGGKWRKPPAISPLPNKRHRLAMLDGGQLDGHSATLQNPLSSERTPDQILPLKQAHRMKVRLSFVQSPSQQTSNLICHYFAVPWWKFLKEAESRKPGVKVVRETCHHMRVWGVRWGTHQLIGAVRVAPGWSNRKVSLTGCDADDLLSQYLTLIQFFCN